MGRRELGVDMQEHQELPSGQAGARIHLGPPPPGSRNQADVGEAGRNGPGGVDAAAVHQDDFQTRAPGQLGQSLGQNWGLI